MLAKTFYYTRKKMTTFMNIFQKILMQLCDFLLDVLGAGNSV